jgi:hypothetical protein
MQAVGIAHARERLSQSGRTAQGAVRGCSFFTGLMPCRPPILTWLEPVTAPRRLPTA